MPDFVNPDTCDLVLSANDMPPPWLVCTRQQSDAWAMISRQYRKWVVDHVEEMTAPEKQIADDAARDARRNAAVSQLQQAEDVVRAFMLVVLDELNNHAAKHNAILDAIDAGTNVATIKAGIAAVQDYPTRTEQQLRAAIRAKLGT